MNKTPYAIICRQHGQQFLTHEQYMAEIMQPHSCWTCPICGDTSE